MSFVSFHGALLKILGDPILVRTLKENFGASQCLSIGLTDGIVVPVIYTRDLLGGQYRDDNSCLYNQ
jgi:hypothetical protein